MHRRIRRALSLLFLLSFLVAAPALIISSAGYRYNFLKGRIERTGVLFASSKPSAARIILNEGDTGKRTPSRVRRLLPGTYGIRLEKDGYHHWERIIEIASRETTFINNTILFLDATPEPVVDFPVTEASFSPNRRYAAVQTPTESHTELRVVDLKSGAASLPYRAENVSGASLSVTWSSDSTGFFMTRTSGNLPLYFIWHKDRPDGMMNLIEIAPAIYEDAFWSPNGRFLYAVAGGTLFSIDIRSRTAVESGPAAESMRIIDSTVFGVFRDASGTTLVRRSLQDRTFEVVGTIPTGDYRQLGGNTRRIALHDAGASRLILIDPSVGTNRLTYHELRADAADWSKDGILLYRNGLELHIFDPFEGTDLLVTRLGGGIGVARWYPENRLVIYSNGEDALVTEASNDPRRNLMPIAEFDALHDIAIDAKGLNAWFVGRIGETEGLWMLRLR